MEGYNVRTEPLAKCCLGVQLEWSLSQASFILLRLVSIGGNPALVNYWTSIAAQSLSEVGFLGNFGKIALSRNWCMV